ncbi:MAG TPA: hypothetical protein VLD39_06935 [Gammaproteobacteria bacterium]|nr:hypothetical protein [Gammaproteobacteria bacterium]
MPVTVYYTALFVSTPDVPASILRSEPRYTETANMYIRLGTRPYALDNCLPSALSKQLTTALPPHGYRVTFVYFGRSYTFANLVGEVELCHAARVEAASPDDTRYQVPVLLHRTRLGHEAYVFSSDTSPEELREMTDEARRAAERHGTRGAKVVQMWTFEQDQLETWVGVTVETKPIKSTAVLRRVRARIGWS